MILYPDSLEIMDVVYSKKAPNGKIASWVNQGHRQDRLFEYPDIIGTRWRKNDQALSWHRRVSYALEALSAGHGLPDDPYLRKKNNALKLLGESATEKQIQEAKYWVKQWMEDGTLKPLSFEASNQSQKNHYHDFSLSTLISIGQWGDLDFFKDFLVWMGPLKELKISHLEIKQIFPMSSMAQYPRSLPCLKFFAQWMEENDWYNRIRVDDFERSLLTALKFQNFQAADFLWEHEKNQGIQGIQDFLSSLIRENRYEKDYTDALKWCFQKQSSWLPGPNLKVPLIEASQNHHDQKVQLKIIDLLMANGQLVDQVDKNGVTALVDACLLAKNIEVVRLLIDHGANIDQFYDKKPLFLHICNDRENHYRKELIKIFLENKVDLSSEQLREGIKKRVSLKEYGFIKSHLLKENLNNSTVSVPSSRSLSRRL